MSNSEAYLKSAEACFEEELHVFNNESKKILLLASIAQSLLALAEMMNERRNTEE